MNRSATIPGLCCMLVLVLALAGCEDEEPQSTVFSGALIFVEDESPLPDLGVTLFDPDTQTAVASTITDSDGGFEFRGILAGSYIPVVRANGLRPVFLPRARWRIEQGDNVHVILRMRRTQAISTNEFTLNARVIDAETKEPIANARAEMNFLAGSGFGQVNWSEYEGWSTTLEATSDEDGRFTLSPLTIFTNAQTGETFVLEYRVVAPGYRARVMPRHFDPRTLSVTPVTVRLSRGEDLGVIEGVVVGPDGKPRENVPVSAEWRQQTSFSPRDFEKEDDFAGPQDILMPNGVSWTNPRGEYRLTGLPRGHYNVLAGAYPDDGWVGILTGGFQIEGFDDRVEANVVVFPAIRTLEPPDGAVLGNLPERLAWEPDKGAIAWDLKLSRGSDGASAIIQLDEPVLEINPGANFFKGGGSFAWEVIARDADQGGLSQTDRPQVFHVMPQEH
jgi:hypothetical protein